MELISVSAQESREIVSLDMDRLTAQALRLSPSMITLRDLFRVLWTKYQMIPPSAKSVPRSLLTHLRMFLPYRHRSTYQLRHFVRRVLKDARYDALVKVMVSPPVDSALGKALQEAFPELKEVVVIPDLSQADPSALNFYLGLVAAKTFAPHFVEGQKIGLGGGRAVFAFAKSLPNFVKVNRLHFYALSVFRDSLVSIADAEKAIGELVVDSRWKHSENGREFEGVVNPKGVKGHDLDWAFVGIGELRENAWRDYADELFFDFSAAQKAGAVAELLFHFFSADGKSPVFPLKGLENFETAPISVLREMVRLGRPVVALAGGKGKALAVLAVYKAHQYGGPLFNYLVTDEACAAEMLRLAGYPKRMSDLPNRSEWWEFKNQFLVTHLRYSASPPCKTNTEIARRLGLPRKKVQQLLKEATEGTKKPSPLFSFSIRVPSPEFSLEIALIRRYKLLDARVVPHFVDSSEQLTHLGAAAAQLFCELLRDRTSITIGLGSGYEVRTMVECLDLPHTLRHFPKLRRLEFWGLSESPLLTLTQGLSTQTIVASIALRCSVENLKTQVRCHYFSPRLAFENLDAAFFTVRSPYEGDPRFLESAGLKGAKSVWEKQPIGFLLNQFFDRFGNPILPEGHTKCISSSILQSLVSSEKPVIALNARAFEDSKQHAMALKVACVNRLVNSLVVPRPIAEALLQG